MKNKNTLNKISMYIAKTAEIIHWIGAILAIALLVCAFAAKDILSGIVLGGNTEISCYGFNISVLGNDGSFCVGAFVMFAIAAAVTLSLFAMVFRNAYLILKTAEGKTWFAKGSTPFQKDIVRMLKEIGIFLIAVPVTGLIISIIACAVIGSEAAEISVRFDGIIIGLLVLCLSNFFAYGSELQKDVDGLL